MPNQHTQNKRRGKTVLYAQEKQARMYAASNLQREVDARRELELMLGEKRVLGKAAGRGLPTLRDLLSRQMLDASSRK